MAFSNPDLSFDTELISSSFSLQRYLQHQPVDSPRGVPRPINIREIRGVIAPATLSPIPELVRRRIFVRRAASTSIEVRWLMVTLIESLQEFGRLAMRASLSVRIQLQIPQDIKTAMQIKKLQAALALLVRQVPLLRAERERLNALARSGEATWDDVNQLAVPLESMTSIMRLRDEIPPLFAHKKTEIAYLKAAMDPAANKAAQG